MCCVGLVSISSGGSWGTGQWRPELAEIAQGGGKRPSKYIGVTDLGQRQLFPLAAVTDCAKEPFPLKT